MVSAGERRRLNPAVGELGIAGLALLRLHATREIDLAHECIDEIRRIVAALDDAGPVEVRTPFLDVVTGYGRWATVYDSPGNPLIEVEEPAIQPLLAEMDGDPLLDAACGTGRHLTYLAGRGHRVIGVDVVPEMINQARTKTPTADYRLGDLTALPVADGEVRGAVCSLALEHVEELGLAFSELARVVAPGGTIVTSTMHPVLRSIYGWGAWFVDDQGKADIPTFEHSFSDYVSAASEAGLVLTTCREPLSPRSALPYDASLPSRVAYSAAPMVLVLRFTRP